MEALQDLFGNGIDLAAVASGAGLFGGSASTALVMLVSGAFKRFVIRTLMTAILTGVGFLFLLDYLGFEIVPPEELRSVSPQISPYGQSFDAAPGALPEDGQEDARIQDGKRAYIVRSPFSRQD